MHTKVGNLTICTDRPAGQCQIFSPETVVRTPDEADMAASIAKSLGVDFVFVMVPSESIEEWEASGWTVLGTAVVFKDTKR